MVQLLLAVFGLLAGAAGAHGPAMAGLRDVEARSADAAEERYVDVAVEGSRRGIDGSVLPVSGPIAPGSRFRIKQAALLDPAVAERRPRPPADIPPPGAAPASSGGFLKNIPSWAVYGGAAVLGGVQGYLSAGLAGAAGGIVLGLGAAMLYQRGDYGGAFGWTMGGIIGFAAGGPLGALVGAVLGGLAGHFLGRLFFK